MTRPNPFEEEHSALRQRIAELEGQLTRHQETHRALYESKSRFNTIFQHSPLGIVITRLSDNQLLEVNEVWLSYS